MGRGAGVVKYKKFLQCETTGGFFPLILLQREFNCIRPKLYRLSINPLALEFPFKF